MTREIKFRAWNKEINTMGSALPLRVWTDDIATDIGREKYLRNRDNIILMQFTGLFDRNGKEIYERDIIQFYPNAPFRVDWNEEYGKYMYHQLSNGIGAGGFTKLKAKQCEVIGNIYENPELLK